jgi:hypothetical protein
VMWLRTAQVRQYVCERCVAPAAKVWARGNGEGGLRGVKDHAVATWTSPTQIRLRSRAAAASWALQTQSLHTEQLGSTHARLRAQCRDRHEVRAVIDILAHCHIFVRHTELVLDAVSAPQVQAGPGRDRARARARAIPGGLAGMPSSVMRNRAFRVCGSHPCLSSCSCDVRQRPR